MGNKKEHTLSARDRKSLSSHPVYPSLISCLNFRLKQLRDNYDEVKPEELKTLQGRVFEIKALLDMLGGQTDGEPDDRGDNFDNE